ncbi:unnamed protein product [Toxocara canis]|uniref:Secreted protein n=1 Tax=Toxocara canis TaxID=6265 RepID=A0A183VC81_TOXCA|nr:unnamed protein product [Toxocara canis]
MLGLNYTQSSLSRVAVRGAVTVVAGQVWWVCSSVLRTREVDLRSFDLRRPGGEVAQYDSAGFSCTCRCILHVPRFLRTFATS